MPLTPSGGMTKQFRPLRRAAQTPTGKQQEKRLNKLRFVWTGVCALSTTLAAAAPPGVEGLVTLPSSQTVDATIEKFEAAAKKSGFVVFARLDHAAAAEAVGLKMPRATVIVFGNPRLGTPVFLKNPTVAIDLPPKAMVWADETGKVFVSYNTGSFLHGTVYPRHGIAGNAAAAERLDAAFAAIAAESVK